MILGRVLFRDIQLKNNDKKQFILVGKIWLPADTQIKGEHIHTIVGEETAREGQPVMLLQALLNGAQDVSAEAKNKDPNKLLRLITLY